MDNSGPAFPTNEIRDANGDLIQYADSGITLREFVAAQALGGLIARIPESSSHGYTRDGLIRAALSYADDFIYAARSAPTTEGSK